MIINGFVAICTTENSVEIIALIADALDLGRQMAKDRGAGVVIANAGDLKHTRLALGAVPELARNDTHHDHHHTSAQTAIIQNQPISKLNSFPPYRK